MNIHMATSIRVGGWLGRWVRGWVGEWVGGWVGAWVRGWLGAWVCAWVLGSSKHVVISGVAMCIDA